MKIGLDTSFLDRPSSGISTYLTGLRAGLEASFPEIELIDISPDTHSVLNRLGTKGARYVWESFVAGVAARKRQLDILHMPMMARPAFAGVPVVSTVHDVIPFVMPEYQQSRAQRINLVTARYAVQRASAVIAPSEHAASDIVAELGIPRDRIWVTPEAADQRYQPHLPGLPQPPRLRDLGITGPYVFNISGLDVRKNVPALCRAFASMIGQLAPGTQLVVAGAVHSANRAVFPPLEPLIRELGMEGRIVLTGRVSDDDKVILMQNARLYVTPSLYEGFGLTVLEAMACGIPVIAANRTSLPEVVGDAGLLVEPLVPELAAAMVSVLTNPELAADLKRKGLEHAATFSWERTAAQTVDVYNHVLSAQGRNF